MLRQMRGRRRFAAAALEIRHGDDLQMLAAAAMRQIPARGAAGLVEMSAKLLDLRGGIGTASARGYGGQGAFALERQIAQIAAFDAQKLRRFVQLKGAERFFGRGRKEFATMGVQAFGEILRLARDQSRNVGDRFLSRWSAVSCCPTCGFAKQ